jgi:hypothetical protein
MRQHGPAADRPTVWIDGVGLLGPGLRSWRDALPLLRGEAAYIGAPTVLPAPERLPAAERRRAGAAVKLALAVADEAVAQAGVDPGTLATVFTSSSGEGNHCHALCETLAGPAPMVSPTRFTNSVHNAPSGYWHIAVASRASSTSLCAFDGSFGAGLIEAVLGVLASGHPLLLVASDSPYPEPLHATRPLPDHFGVAFLLAPSRGPASIAAIGLAPGDAPAPADCRGDTALDALSRAIPAAAALPLLQAMARGGAARRIALDYLPTMGLQIDLQPCR